MHNRNYANRAKDVVRQSIRNTGRWDEETSPKDPLLWRIFFLMWDAFSVRRLYTVRWYDDRWRIGKGSEGISCHLLRYYSGTCLEGLRKTTKNLYNRCPGRDSNRTVPEYNIVICIVVILLRITYLFLLVISCLICNLLFKTFTNIFKR
jgi:hypothetical protein